MFRSHIFTTYTKTLNIHGLMNNMIASREFDIERHFSPPTNLELRETCEECIICSENIAIRAYYSCSHMTCYLCALRIRKYGDLSCPVCRAVSHFIHITPISREKDVARHVEKSSGIMYNDGAILSHIHQLESFRCPFKQCWDKGGPTFANMASLKNHVSKVHKKVYCESCLESKPCFLIEQELYDVSELDLHLKGELLHNSKAFLGHIFCLFCRKYFYDIEIFSRHMREAHIACDLCEQASPNRYFQDRRRLCKHFENDHYICKHPACSREDLIARTFSSEIELQAHSVSAHKTRAQKKIPLNPTSLGFRFDPRLGAGPISRIGVHSVEFRSNVVIFDFVTHQKKVDLKKFSILSSNHRDDYADLGQVFDSMFITQNVEIPSPVREISPFGSVQRTQNSRYRSIVMSGSKHHDFISSRTPQGVKTVQPLECEKKHDKQGEKESLPRTERVQTSDKVPREAKANSEVNFPSLHRSYGQVTLDIRGRLTKKKKGVWG